LVEQYTKQGFDNTLQFYTHGNRLATHSFSHEQGNWTITQPTLSLYPTEDPVADWIMVAGLLNCKHFLPNSRIEVIRAQHWPQLESPNEFNKILKEWLDDLKDRKQSHMMDEL